MKIYLRYGEPASRAYRRFQKKLEDSGWRGDVKRHEYHETEGQRRRRERGKNKQKMAAK